MKVFTGADAFKLFESRCPKIFTIPDGWQIKTYLDPGKNYKPRAAVVLKGRGTFGGQCDVRIAPTKQEGIRFSKGGKFTSAVPENASTGYRCLSIGEGQKVHVVEHLMALRLALGLEANISLPPSWWISSVPTFPGCLKEVVSALLPDGLIESGPAHFRTINQVIGLKFGKAYIVFEPGPPEDGLTIDHAFSHKVNPPGHQRIVYKLNPDSFAYICGARPLMFGIKAKLASRLHRFGAKGIAGTSLKFDSSCVVTKKGFLNPSGNYVDANGNDLEIILHEVIDVLGALGLLGRLCGKVTTFRLSHKNAVKACRHFKSHLVDAANNHH
jgi:UDP-3-O-acyl-N-acetylglucosamine deacetylase